MLKNEWWICVISFPFCAILDPLRNLNPPMMAFNITEFLKRFYESHSQIIASPGSKLYIDFKEERH